MPPAKKYNDFAEGEPRRRISKRCAASSDDERLYVPVTCPHCRLEFVEIPTDRLASNKASECRKHLAACPSNDAEMDPRQRSSPPSQQQQRELEAANATLSAQITTLTASETRLISSNDQLTSRVASLERQMEELRLDMERRDRQRDQRDARRDALLVQICEKLGIRTPPVPSIDTFVRRIDHLQKGSQPNKRSRELEDVDTQLGLARPGDHTARMRTIAQLMRIKTGRSGITLEDIANARYRGHRGCQGEAPEASTGLAKDIAESDALRRKLRAVLHPDKIADPNELRVANAVRSALGL